jgi:hypothetical protein
VAKSSEVLSTRGRVLVGGGLLAATAGFIIPVVAGGLSSAPAAPNPPGNNGTVKIDGTPFDSAPDNEPHVGCTFQVDFYGFDEGDLDATVTFESHPPTGPVQTLLTDTVFIGEDDNSGGGSEAGLDASETYTLDFTGIEPHPQQGFHVKLTINAEGSQGADVKHKVFWVTGCETPPTTTSTSSSTTSTSSSTTTTPTTAPTSSAPSSSTPSSSTPSSSTPSSSAPSSSTPSSSTPSSSTPSSSAPSSSTPSSSTPSSSAASSPSSSTAAATDVRTGPPKSSHADNDHPEGPTNTNNGNGHD